MSEDSSKAKGHSRRCPLCKRYGTCDLWAGRNDEEQWFCRAALEDPAPGRVRPRPGAWAEIRLLLAEWLLGLALRIAPPDHPQSELMARLAWLYVTRMRKDIERLEREWMD